MDRTGRRPLVVIENARTDAVQAQAEAIQDAGFDVSVCSGPGAHACPLLAGETCALIDDADLVVYDLDLDNPQHRAVLAVVRARRPGLPIVVEASTRTARAHAGDLAVDVVTVPYSMAHLADAVAAALEPA